MSADTTPAPLAFFQMITQFQLAQAVYVAAELGIADLLASGPKAIDELAHATGTHAPTLGLLMRALSSADVFAEAPDGRFSLTPLASYLRSDTPTSQRGWARMSTLGYQTWAELLYTVKTGKPAFERIFGTSYYDYMAQHPNAAAIWDAAMDQTARDWLGALATSYDFAHIGTVVDVGGGHGTLLAALLGAVPTLRGILFDLPHVVAAAGPVLAAAGTADRCRIVGGDMFADVPPDADAYLLARVLFNWDDEHALAIIKSCRRAMPAHAKLLVVDIVDSDRDRPSSAAFGDLNLLVLFGDHQRTESQFHSLFGAAGLKVGDILPTPSHFRLVEGLPI